MTSIFPVSASVGQVFNSYIFDGTSWNIDNSIFENYLEESNASATYLDKISASTTYATKDYADNSSSVAAAAVVDAAPEALNTLNELAAALNDDANFASTVSTSLGNKAPIVNPVFTSDIQVDGQINLLMSGSVATSYISSFDDLFAGGPSTKLLGRYVQVETDTVGDQFAKLSLQPGIASLTASGESSYVTLSGASGQYLNSFDPNNQIATIGNLGSINGESDQFILPGQIFG